MWLKIGDAAQLMGVTERTIRRRAIAGRLRMKEDRGTRGGSGGRCYLVALESLPPEAQKSYLSRLLPAGLPALRKPAAPPPPPGRIRTTAELVAKYGRDKAGRILEGARKQWEDTVKEALALKRRENSTGKLTALAVERGTSLRTLYRKMEAYKKEGILGLVSSAYRAPGEGMTGKKRRAVTPEQEKYIKALALRWPPPTGVYIYEELQRVSEAKGWSLPSRQTVYRVIQDIRRPEKELGQWGDKAYEAKYMPKIKRDYTRLLAMEEIVGDGHTFDVFVSHQGRPVRPELSAWEDLRTRKLVGWCITVKANSESIGMALYHAVTTHGIPGTIYVDNGKDYLSHYIEDVCGRLDINIRNCIPKTPRSKAVESLFKTVNRKFAIHLPGYCSGDPKKRHVDFNEKKLHKQGRLLTLEEFVKRWEQWVEWYNNQHVHSELEDTPANVYDSVRHFRPGQVDPRKLAVLMMKKERVKVHDGYITLFKREYWAHSADLARIVGEYVDVWYDFNSMGEVLVWYKGKCIGTAVNRRALLHGEDRAELARQMKEARAAKKVIKMDIAGYTDGIEDILPDEIVNKASRVKKRYHTGTGEKQKAGREESRKVRRLTGGDNRVREALEILEKSRAAGYPGEEPVNMTRTQRMYAKAGAEILARKS